MIDPRFYEAGWAPSATDIATLADGEVVRGDPDRRVATFASASNAGPDALTFLEAGQAGMASRIAAGICLASPEVASLLPADTVVVTSRHPRAAFGQAAARIAVLRVFEPGQSAIHPAAKLAASAVIEPGVVIGAGAAIGSGTRIGANTVIGPGVQIGARGRIGAGCVIRCALIGDDVTMLSGAVIGESGFGLAADGGAAALTPHFGRVILQDRVSVGANSCIDRGLLDDTVIGEAAHIDNLCHIGHNTRVGARTVMAAFAGVSGSVEIGDNVQFGGRVGVKDHIRIGKDARIAAGAAVLKDVGAGETHAGYPAKPAKTWMRELAWLAEAAQKRSRKD